MKYLNILGRLYNVPLLVDANKLDIISKNVITPILKGEQVEDNGFSPTKKEIKSSNDVAVIEVFDSLVSKNGGGASGFTSYAGIKNKTIDAIEKGYSKIGYYIDSPGGEVSGLFALTDFINSIPKTYGINTFAFTDGSMTSAAYAIGSATQKVYSTSTAMSGSIAAIMDIINVSKANEQKGIEHYIIRSKEEKALGNPHEEMSDTTLEMYKNLIDNVDKIFNNEVERNRPILTVDKIMSMKGRSYMASEALELNLIDQIVTSFDEVISLETSKTKVNVMTLEEYKQKVDALEAELSKLKVSNQTAITEAVTNERVRCSQIFSAGDTLKIKFDHVLKRVNAGTSFDDTKDIFAAIAEGLDNAKVIDSSTTITPSVTDAVLTGQEQTIEVEGLGKINTKDILNSLKGAK